jgi:hypothetical protein
MDTDAAPLPAENLLPWSTEHDETWLVYPALFGLYKRARQGVAGIWTWVCEEWKPKWGHLEEGFTYCCPQLRTFALSLLAVVKADQNDGGGGAMPMEDDADDGEMPMEDDADEGEIAGSAVAVNGANEQGEDGDRKDAVEPAKRDDEAPAEGENAAAKGDNGAAGHEVQVINGGDDGIEQAHGVEPAKGDDEEEGDGSASDAEEGEVKEKEEKKGSGGRPSGSKTVYPFNDAELMGQMRGRFNVVPGLWEDTLKDGEALLKTIGSSTSDVSLVIADPFYESVNCYTSEHTLHELKTAGNLASPSAVFIKWVCNSY